MKEQEELNKDSTDGAPEKDAIETRTAKIWLGDDGILRVIVKRKSKVALTDAKKNITAATEIVAGHKTPVFTDLSGIRSINRDARNYFSGKEASSMILAQALLVDSSISKIIGNFFLGLNKPAYPTKLFTSEEAALAWLRGFIK